MVNDYMYIRVYEKYVQKKSEINELVGEISCTDIWKHHGGIVNIVFVLLHVC